MKTILLLGCLILGGLFTGCAASGHLNTPSGRPEVFIEHASLDQVMDVCAARLISQGYVIETQTDYSLIGSKSEHPSQLPGFLIGLAFDIITRDTTPHSYPDYSYTYKSSYLFIRQDTGIRLFHMSSCIVHQDGSAGTESESNSQDAYEALQRELEDIEVELRPVTSK